MQIKSRQIISCLLVLAVLAGCSPSPLTPLKTSLPERPGKELQSQVQRVSRPDAPQAEVEQLSAGNRRFAFDLYQALRGQPGNLFVSPYSVSLALAMTYAGAGGRTAAEMAQTLHFDLPAERLHPAFNSLDLALQETAGGGKEGESQKFQLSVANSLWGQQDFPFLPDYLDRLAMNYGAGLRLVDFKADPEAAREAINAWISQKTQEKIKNALGQGAIKSTTRLALVNAIYFNADWKLPFAAANTRNLPFNRLEGGTVDVPMMSFSEAERLAYAAGDGYQALELPYVGDTASMVVVVPEPGNFPAFEAGLTAQKLDQVLAGLQEQPVSLVLPKFKFEGAYQLNDTLSGMGMANAFSPQADFSGMDGQRDLFIGSVIHKTFVAVDEKGTEAAAATIVAMEVSAMLNPPVRLVVDRPFIFLIRDKTTGSILFLGRVTDPSK